MPAMVAKKIDQSKRAALFGGVSAHTRPIRPPWTDEERLADACTRCGDCMSACPERVLVAGQGGFPEFNPGQGTGACTFCRACVEACDAPVFDPARITPWSLIVHIENISCLAHAGIHCSSCSDACDEDAVQMRPRIGGPPLPTLSEAKCTGCGACVGICPGQAVTLFESNNPEVLG